MPKPDNLSDDRTAIQALQNSDWNGWHGNDKPFVDCSDKDIDQALKELHRRVEDRLREYEDSLEYTSPSEERRQEKARRQHILENLPGKAPASGT